MFRKTLKEEEEGEGGGDAAPAPVVPDPRISLAPFAPAAHLPPPTQPNDTGIASVSSALAELSVTPSPSHKTTAKKPSRSPQSAARSAHKQASPAPPTASDAPSPFAPFTATASPPVPAPLFSFNLSSSESLPPPNASMFAALAPPPIIPASPFTFAAAAGQPQVGQPPMPVPIPMFAAKSPAAAPKAGAKPKPEPAPKLEERRVLRLARAKAAPSQEVTNQRPKTILPNYLALLSEATLLAVLRYTEGPHDTRYESSRVMAARVLRSPDDSLRGVEASHGKRMSLFEAWPIIESIGANIRRLSLSIPEDDSLILTQPEQEALDAAPMKDRSKMRDSMARDNHRTPFMRHLFLDLPCLTWLSMHGSHLDETALVDFYKNTTITLLDLRSNLMNAKACEYLIANTTLLTLDVRSNPIGIDGLEVLASSQRLQTLAAGPIRSDWVSARNEWPFPESMLSNNLRNLRLEFVPIKENGSGHGLDSLLRHRSINYLELVHCKFPMRNLASSLLAANNLVHFLLVDDSGAAEVAPSNNPSLTSLHLPFSAKIKAPPPNLHFTSHHHLLPKVRDCLEQLKRDRENVFLVALALAMERTRPGSDCLLSRLPVDMIAEILRHLSAVDSTSATRDMHPHITFVFRNVASLVAGIRQRQHFLDGTPLRELLLTREPHIVFW